jgi:site-specific DNA-methyltransferase (adenine-specific)
MPEQLLGRIIRISSNPQDLVVDPFAGSGTTLAVAKKLGRRWLGIELSADYVQKANARLRSCRPGGALDGPEDPVRSAPKTSQGKRRVDFRNGRPVPPLNEETEKGLIDAYTTACKGLSTDAILCDPELNEQFVAACRKNALRGDAAIWNRLLLRIRKRGKLPKVEGPRRRSTFEAMDAYSHASEIALGLLSLDYGMSLDEILSTPDVAATFDRLAAEFDPEQHTPFEHRWAAMALRKRAMKSKKHAKERFGDWLTRPLPRKTPLDRGTSEKHEHAGVFVLLAKGKPLYVAETFNVRGRIERILKTDRLMDLGPDSVRIVPTDSVTMQHGLQSILIGRTGAPLNSALLRPECVGTA